MAVDTELRKRKKLEDVNSLDDIVNLIQSSKNVMVLAGAGIRKVQKPCSNNRNQHKLWHSRFPF
jgi:TPP-dependent trihydroxycyclohexane-1,2-dione (THcHDO) dehydratase